MNTALRSLSLALAFSLLAPATGSTAKPATNATGPTVAQLRQDLQFLARNLPKRHKNAFHYTTQEQFQAAVEDLDRHLDHLNEDEFDVGIMRLAAMIGDSHTRASMPREAVRLFPVIVRDFDEGYRIVQVGPGFEKALGCRVLQIDDTPAEKLFSILSPLAAQNENPSFARAWVNLFLNDARVLHGAGITGSRETARYTLEDDAGQKFSLDIAPVTADELQAIDWIRPVKETQFTKISEPMHKASPTFSFTYVPEARTVYADVRSMKEVKQPARELFEFIRERQPDKLIIDLRQNPGGNYFHGLHHLIEPIAKLEAINRKGHLFVLIGPLTGSAAVINAAQFHTMTQAILVGQPIGAKPSEFSELKTMSLPNTGMQIGYSVRYYDFAYNKENVVAPDHEARATWDEIRNGMNPVIEWCLAYGETSSTPSASR